MVGRLMKTRREALGLSQTEVARRAGSTQRQVSRLENNEEATMPRRDTLERFGAVLGITVPEFYQAAGMIEIHDGEEQPLPDYDLPPELIAALRAMVRDHPELRTQFAAHSGDPDFALQVEGLAVSIGYLVRGFLAGGGDPGS